MTRRQAAFTSLFVVLIGLAVLPPILEWSNRIEPRFLGLSFAITWQLLVAALMSAALIVWYFLDSAAGDLDIGADIAAAPHEQDGGEER